MFFEFYFIDTLIFLFSFIIFLKIFFDTFDACHLAPKAMSDNGRMIGAAKKFRFFEWPSKIHSIKTDNGEVPRAELREYWVIFLSLILKLYKNKLTDHPSINLSLVSNLISSILIFQILRNYFNLECAILGFLLYVSLFWPYAIAIHKGHSLLSQCFFLLSLYTLQLTEVFNSNFDLLLYFISGSLIFISFSASSASRKFPVLLLFALFYSLKEHLLFTLEKLIIFIIISFLILIFFKINNFFINKFQNSLINIFNKFLKTINWKLKYLFLLNKIFFLAIFLIFFIINFYDFEFDLFIKLLFFSIGLLLIFLHIFLPLGEFKNNIIRYFVWLNASSWTSHFSVYPDPEKIFKTKIDKDFRGGGLIWYHRLFFRMMPIAYLLYIFLNLLCLTLIFFYFQRFDFLEIFNFFLIFLISITPLFIHEYTKGMKVGRTLFSIVPSTILSIIYNYYFITNNFFSNFNNLIIIIPLILQFIHSYYVIFYDLIPCRMAANILKKKLLQLDCKMFYTYDNPYNDNFVKVMIDTYPNLFKVEYIKTIKQVKKGIVVIPHTSSKAYGMESQEYSAKNGDFRKDETLNNLLDSKKIEENSIFKIKTYGTSKIYAQYSEVTTYRDLILNDITKNDRWLSNAWIIKI